MLKKPRNNGIINVAESERSESMNTDLTGTIAAIATAQGTGGIGIVRISGENAFEVAKKVFTPADGADVAKIGGYTMKFGHIFYNEEPLDEAVALFFRGPKSYTAEDVVELQCHGGNVMTKLVLRAVLAAGARAALPGEFTRRAFENGRLSLTKAEAVAALINAGSEEAAKVASQALSGRTGNAIGTIVEELTDAAAALNVWADFPEDDIPPVDTQNLVNVCKNSLKRLSDILSSSEIGIRSRAGIRTVIAGRPNVGKSSLMNMLAGCDRCIVTDIPGTTRDVVEEKIDLGSVTLALADTAGLRSSDDTVESIGINEAKKRIDNAQLVLAVFDASEELTSEDAKLLNDLKNRMVIAVVNKTDKENKIDREYITSKIQHIVYISAKEKTGLDELRDMIEELIGKNTVDPSLDLLTNERQLAAAGKAKEELSAAYDDLCAGVTLDAVTIRIEAAIDHLLELTGERASDKVIDNIFANFCVGK